MVNKYLFNLLTLVNIPLRLPQVLIGITANHFYLHDKAN